MQNLRRESDEKLVQLYENGNDSAFDVLLERYQTVVFNYILSLVDDEEVANDVFQDTFYKVIVNIRSHRYVDDGRFQAWVMRIARNAVFDLFRRTKPCVDATDQRAVNRECQRGTLSVIQAIDEELEQAEKLEHLHEMIAMLPEPQQDIVRMRVELEMSFKEIAEVLGCSINTALGRMRYAVLNLRKMAPQFELEA